MRMTGHNGPLGKYGAYALFGLGWWRMPTKRARSLFLATGAATCAGFLFMDVADPVETGYAPTGWFPNASVTVLSIGFWILAAWLGFNLVVEVRRYKAAARQYLAMPPAPLPQPVAPPTATVTKTYVDAATSPPERLTDKLWTPSTHVPYRRVRRGGETLAGTPIKDRRAVDPRRL